MGRTDKDRRRHSHQHNDDDDRRHKSSKRTKHHEKKRKKHEKRKKKRRRRDDEYSSSSDNHSDSSRDRRHKKKKKKQENKHERNFQVADALYDLLSLHPGLATDLPIMLIRLAGGTTLDFRKVSDPTAGQGLNRVMQSLAPFGVSEKGGTWSWEGPKKSDDDLVLIKVVRALLSEIGITVNAFREFDRKQEHEAEEKKVISSATTSERGSAESFNDKHDKVVADIRHQTRDLLANFEQNDKKDTQSMLSKELADICNLVLSGETIDIQGLPNEELRDALGSLFQSIGLDMFEMEQNDDSDNQDEEDTSGMGYGLGDGTSVATRDKLTAVIQECQTMEQEHSKTMVQPRRVLGPSLPPPSAGMNASDTSSDEEEGPAPAGSAKAKKRVPRGPARMPAKEADSADTSKREEWMMVPGEHDFLQGIKSGSLKNRSFKNEKQRQEQQAQEPLPPEVQAQMDAIQQAHENARGPTLMEQHRSKQAAEKSAKSQDWKWNREKDLDDGRRVDKNALHMVMGGAKTELKSKFQGGYSKGFM